MAAINEKSHSYYHTRSISLPSRSHPSTVKIEQVVNKIKTWKASSSMKIDIICNSLSGLKELYEGIEELLAMPLTRLALARRQHDNRINELLDESVRYIDICSNTRDAIMLMKEGIRELQSAFRRSKLGDMSIENDVIAFINSRKDIQKEISKSLAKSKHTDNRMLCSLHQTNSNNHQLLIVVRALTEASLLTMSTFSSLLLFLSVPVFKSKPTKWSLVSKLVNKGVLSCDQGERNNLNELENVDIALNNLLVHGFCKDAGTERIESAQRRLEALETVIESLENGLELLLRHLIRTRVSLLNIHSQ